MTSLGPMMRDGIYKVDFRSGRPEGRGVAMLSGGVFRGIDQKCVYFGELEILNGRANGLIECQQYKRERGMSVRSGKLKLEAVEANDGFKGFTESEADSGSRQGVFATWIDEL
jgi:hypothetical protein